MTSTFKQKLKPVLKPIHRSYLRTRQSIVGTTVRPINYFHAYSRTAVLNLFTPKEIRQIDTDERVRELRKNGFITLPDFYDPKLIQDIQADFDRAMADDSLVNKQKHSKTFKNIPFEEHMPRIYELLRNKEFLKIMHAYYKSYFSLQYLSGTRLFPIPEKERRPQDLLSANWHCDDHATDMVHLVVYLHDVTSEHGPTHLISCERTAQLMKMGFYSRYETTLPEEVMEDPNYVKQLTGKIGTAHLVASPRLLHKAGIPSAGYTRDSLFFSFRPGMEPVHLQNFSSVKRRIFKLLNWFSEDWRNPQPPIFRNQTIIYKDN